MRKASIIQGCQSRGLKRRPLLRTSSPLNPKINRELALRLVQQTGALQHVPHWFPLTAWNHSRPTWTLANLPTQW